MSLQYGTEISGVKVLNTFCSKYSSIAKICKYLWSNIVIEHLRFCMLYLTL